MPPSNRDSYTAPSSTSYVNLQTFLYNYINLKSFRNANDTLNPKHFHPFNFVADRTPNKFIYSACEPLTATYLSDYIASDDNYRSGASALKMKEMDKRFKEVQVLVFVMKCDRAWKIAAYAVANTSRGQPVKFWPPAEGQPRHWATDALEADVLVRLPMGPEAGMVADEARQAQLARLLNWERCLELLKSEARVAAGREERSENPIKHVGVLGLGWNMRACAVPSRASVSRGRHHVGLWDVGPTRGGVRGCGQSSRVRGCSGRLQVVQSASTMDFEVEDSQDKDGRNSEHVLEDDESELDEMEEMLLGLGNRVSEDGEDESEVDEYHPGAGAWYYDSQYSAKPGMIYVSPYSAVPARDASLEATDPSSDQDMTDLDSENSLSSGSDGDGEGRIHFAEIVDVPNPEVAEIILSSSSSPTSGGENNLSPAQTQLLYSPDRFTFARPQKSAAEEENEHTPPLTPDDGEDDELNVTDVGDGGESDSGYQNDLEVQLTPETGPDED